jgi:enediyne polyketide synthase
MDGRGDHGEPVAIIGIACRFPGARAPAEFHDLAVTGRRMFQPTGALPGRPLRAAMLDDWMAPPETHGDWSLGDLGAAQLDLEQFDFGQLDFWQLDLGQLDLGPVQKLATEMTALALTDAGLREAAGSSRTGMIIASTTPGLCDLVGGQFGFAASGPFPPAARTSSLHAVAAATVALQAGELDLAIAGGAELGLDPVWLALQARAGTLGTGEMRVYAADPAGLLPGEGCGVVILVRSADARAAGVPVYAEIAGWSTVPAGLPELAGPALERAYQRAGADPADIQYIEGQGTGTAAGDSAELAAFTQLRRDIRVVAALGAASAGIGHARAAAGIASLIRTAVAMAAGTIPPGPGGARPHPLIASGDARLRLPDRPEPWPDGDPGLPGTTGSARSARSAGARRPRLAAVHSLGTADPAVLASRAGLRDAEGIHLVLRREADGDRWAGRRRRAGQANVAEAAAPEHVAEAAAPEHGAAGKHTMARGTTTRAEAEHARDASLEVRERTGPPRVFVLRGGNPGTLAGQLDVIAASAVMLSDDGLDGLARQLAAGALQAGNGQAGNGQAGDRPAPLRVALTAAGPHELAGRAGEAARLLRTGAPAAGLAGGPDVRISAGACGAVVVLFPGRAESPAGQPALLAASLEALGTLDAFGVRPTTGVGYGLAEITGLAWAGCIPAAEAARLVAQCGQVLRACARGTAAMARVMADEDLARALAAPGGLHIAAYEGPRMQVLAGSTAGVRELTRRAGPLKVPVEVLDSAAPMYSPGMARCAAPLRSVLAATSFAPPRRRLVSTITGRLITPDDDLAWLLAAQVTRPVLFAQAIAQAARAADLIVIAGPDAGLADRAAECGGVPAVAIPGVQPGPDRTAMAQAVAALFAAGAVTDLTPYLGQARAAGSGGTLASRTVPRMWTGELLAPAGMPVTGAPVTGAPVTGAPVTGAAVTGAADVAGADGGTGPRSAARSAG